MARADRRSAQRAKKTPGIRTSGGATTLESTLFFSRLRKNAKWVFAFLAVTFALSFVVFGVGSEVQGGIADLFQGRAASTGPSVGDAQDRVDENPRDPAALRELATALVNDGRADEAIPILERFLQVRQRDEAALNELATLYLVRGGRLRVEAQQAQIAAQLAAPETNILPPATTPLGEALGPGPVTQAVSGRAQAELSQRIGAMQEAYRQAQQTYERLVVLNPEDAGIQIELAEAALNAGDTAVALASYKRFVELAPDDPQVPLVEQQIKQLETTAGTSTGG